MARSTITSRLSALRILVIPAELDTDLDADVDAGAGRRDESSDAFDRST